MESIVKHRITSRSLLMWTGILFASYFVLNRATPTIGEFYSHLWGKILDLFGHKPSFIFTIGTMASLGLPFWSLVLLFMSLDLWGKPKFLLKFKIQPDKNAPVTWETYKKAVKVININQLVSTVMVLMTYPVMQWRGIPFEEKDLPTLPRLIVEFIYFAVIQETGFYYLHRLMHHPFFYKRIHKLHHEWIAPISLAVVYVHPFEHVLVNMIPILWSPLLIRAHISTSWLWYVTAISVSTIHHSGYHFPGLPSPQFHDYHHLKFNQCFGVLGWFDRFHRTDDQYRKSENYKYDCIYFSATPIWDSKAG